MKSTRESWFGKNYNFSFSQSMFDLKRQPLYLKTCLTHYTRVFKMKGTKELEKIRNQVKERREKEWIEDAVRARRFSCEETFQQGLDLIKFVLEIHGVGENAEHG